MYRIVAHNPDGSSYTIYDPAGAGALPVLAPRSTEELNEAGSLEFALVFGHQAYDRLIPKGTYVSAELDGTEFFYGRLLSPEKSPILGQIQYTCSGALSLLQDSELPADGKKSDGTMDSKTMTAEAFFRKCINNHNADIGNDPRRTFTVGIVNHPDKDKEREYQISSYTDTLSAIKQNIIEWYGGFLRVRSDGNGGHLIDWLSQYGDTDAGTLDLGANIISMTHRISSEDLVTAIRPVGKDGLLLSGSPTIDLFPAEDMQTYGKIVKSVTFNDCDKEADLRSRANEFVARLNNTYHISSDIKLVDMHFVDGQDHGVNLGDVFTNIYGMAGMTLIVGNRSRDFENPQNDSISLKSPRDYEGDTSGGSYNSRNGSSSSLSSRSARNSAGAGYSYKYIHEFQDRLEMNTKEISINAETLELHADQLIETANNYTRLSHKADTIEGKVGIIEGTGVIQNSEHITNIAGKFQLNQENNQVELINGTEFVVHDTNGGTITVGTRISSIDSEVNNLGQRVASFEGSALWTQRNNITGVVGEFDVVTDKDGKKTLRVKSGGGMKILRNNVEFGLYDEGTLSAGIIVDKIDKGNVTIAGNKVAITGQTTIADVMEIAGTNVSIKRPISISGDGSTTIISSTAVSANQIAVRNKLTFGSEGSSDRDITYTQLSTMVKEASLEGQSLKIVRFDGTTFNFNSATTLRGAWSGSALTITATPQNEKYSIGFGGSYGAHDTEFEVVSNGNPEQNSILGITSFVSVPIAVSELANGAASTKRYTKDLVVSVGGLLESKTITENDLYRPGDGKIGFSSVTVDVDTTIASGTASGRSDVIYTWTFKITKGNGKSSNLDIDCRAIYDDARSGYYTPAEYTTYGQTMYNAGSPSSGVVSAKTSTIYTWDFQVTKGDGTTKNLEINCRAIYDDARDGYYTSSQYTTYGTTQYNAGSPTSGAVSTKASTIYTWNFQITKGDGTTKNLEINCSAIYSDARAGYYTSSQYTTYGATQYNSGYSTGQTYGESIGIGGVHHMRLDYTWSSGGAHTNNWWNIYAYNSNESKSKRIQTDQRSTGLYLPIVMNHEFTGNGTFNPWSFTAEGGGTGVVFGPIKINVPGGSASYTKYTFSKTRTQSSDGYHYTFAIGTGWQAPFGSSGGIYDLYKKN